MKIVSLQCQSYVLDLKEPYTIAYEEFTTATNIIVVIETDSGLTGYGVASPAPEVTGETPEKVLEILQTVVEPALKGHDPLRPLFVMSLIEQQLKDYPSARAAVDIALYDLMGVTFNVPVWKMLGGYREFIATSITIGILPEDETVERARGFVKEGFKILKIKGGKNVDDDCNRLHKVREAVGAEIELRFDANQGYSVAQAQELIARTEKINLELIEQPTSKSDPQLLGKVTHSVPIPVMADESMLTPGDAFRLAQNELVDMVNVKLMKVGGLTQALRISALAAAADIEVMIGCMDELELGIAAGLHFALARPNVTCADLDGHFDIIGDPTSGCVILRDGILYPSDRPGFGYRPK